MMINALQLYSDISSRDRQLAGADEDRLLRRNLLAHELAFKQDSARREDAKLNMLRDNAQRNFLAQQMGMQSRERMMGDRMRAQQDMARERLNQPLWDAERGVFVQRPQMGQSGMGGGQGGVITPPGLPPRINKEAQKLQTKAAFELPQAVAAGESAIQQIDEMIGSEKGDIKQHPGFESAVGASMQKVMMPFIPPLPGTDRADFMSRLKQVTGGAFLQAFESLKGGGQITQIEGEKATQAITRMNESQSEAEFRKAAREFQRIIKGGIDRAKKQAGGVAPAAPAAAGEWSVVK